MTQQHEPSRGPENSDPTRPDPMSAAPAGVDAETVTRGQRWRRIVAALLGVVLVAAMVVGGLTLIDRYGANRPPEVGGCVQLTGTREDVDMVSTDCDDDEVTWVVAKEVASTSDCPADNYLAVHSEQWGEELDAFCLIPNLQSGDCYREVDQVNGFVEAACKTEDADFRVAGIHQVEDPTVCGDVGAPYTFPEPARTFCLVEPT